MWGSSNKCGIQGQKGAGLDTRNSNKYQGMSRFPSTECIYGNVCLHCVYWWFPWAFFQEYQGDIKQKTFITQVWLNSILPFPPKRGTEKCLKQSKDKNLHWLLSGKQGKIECLCPYKHIGKISKTLWKASLRQRETKNSYLEGEFCTLISLKLH